HSDHTTTRWYADQARLQYLQAQYKNAVNIPISYYIGYPTRERPTNVFGDDFELKEMAFLTYAKFDGGVCNSKERCNETPTYGSYLGRQYRQDP
ncbi:hypothetical protein H7Y63_00920, partial [Polaromonas sp.]|nr:hypothetical protein [Candidatus Saccharibacteria bacterium]